MWSKATFEREARRAIVYYAIGANAYERMMDRIGEHATDAQWDQLTAWLDQVDADMADTEHATDYQRAKAARQVTAQGGTP